jgi:hypothetical protein
MKPGFVIATRAQDAVLSPQGLSLGKPSIDDLGATFKKDSFHIFSDSTLSTPLHYGCHGAPKLWTKVKRCVRKAAAVRTLEKQGRSENLARRSLQV